MDRRADVGDGVARNATVAVFLKEADGKGAEGVVE
jgi:hypothetical protein